MQKLIAVLSFPVKYVVEILLLKPSVMMSDVTGQKEVEVVVILEGIHLWNALVATSMMDLLLVEIQLMH